MLKKPDQEVQKRLAALAATPDGSALVEWLQMNADKAVEDSLAAMDNNQCRQRQGVAIALRQIVDTLTRRP